VYIQPPEVLAQKSKITMRGEIYSLGIIFFYIVMKRLPWAENEK
jgi:serine/threonine protein kinase